MVFARLLVLTIALFFSLSVKALDECSRDLQNPAIEVAPSILSLQPVVDHLPEPSSTSNLTVSFQGSPGYSGIQVEKESGHVVFFGYFFNSSAAMFSSGFEFEQILNGNLLMLQYPEHVQVSASHFLKIPKIEFPASSLLTPYLYPIVGTNVLALSKSKVFSLEVPTNPQERSEFVSFVRHLKKVSVVPQLGLGISLPSIKHASKEEAGRRRLNIQVFGGPEMAIDQLKNLKVTPQAQILIESAFE